MKSILEYHKLLNALSHSEGLSLRTRVSEDSLWIEGVDFFRALPSDLFQGDFSAKGILTQRLTPKEKEFCRAHSISYLTADGGFLLFRSKSVLFIEPRTVPRRRSKSKATATASMPVESPKPTDLISPNAFAILDVLLRLPEQQLLEYKSGLQFAKAFSLYQPKLSTLMTSMRAKNLVELRRQVANLSIDWWTSALRYPAIRRVFTPFFVRAQPYYSTLGLSDEGQHERYRHLVLSHPNDQLAPGPAAVGQEHGLLRDKDFTVWGSAPAIQKLKKELRLVPGVRRDAPTWFLAIPLYGLRKEAILSRFSNTGNVLRAVWDLSYGGARHVEVQVELLRRLLK